mgnify:FL=1
MLGPTLFLLYIKDITDILNNSVVSHKLFADDIKLYSREGNSQGLQESINQLVAWAEKWQLQLAEEKCFVCRVGSPSIKNLSTLHSMNSYRPKLTTSISDLDVPCSVLTDRRLESPNYTIGTHELKTTENTRDLGVIIDINLKFKHHVTNIVRVASLRSRLVTKSFLSRDTALLKKAFCTYIRPLLEYCSQVWRPHHRCLVDDIERVQKRFTRAIPALRNLPYMARLKALSLQTLEHRRIICDLCLCYKLLHGLTDSDLRHGFQFSEYSSTRGHKFKLKSAINRIDVTKKFLF